VFERINEAGITNTQTDEFDGVWLDTSVLITLLSGKANLTDKTQLNVKKVLLCGHTIRICTLALQELSKNFAIGVSDNIEKQIQSLFDPAPVLFHEPPPFTIEQIERAGIRVLPDYKINHQRLSDIDQLMILQSVLSRCPILSEDTVLIDAIQYFGKQVEIPFPIDEKRLEKVKIEDILSTPGSMRSILIDSLREIDKTLDLKS